MSKAQNKTCTGLSGAHPLDEPERRSGRAPFMTRRLQISCRKARLDEMEELPAGYPVNLVFPTSAFVATGFWPTNAFSHYLEEQRGLRLDEALAEGSVLPPSVRDIGAHAFSNFIFWAACARRLTFSYWQCRPDALAHISY